MKSRFYLLASLLLISCFVSVAYAAKTEHGYNHKSAFDNNGKPADIDKKLRDYSFNEDVEQLSSKEDEELKVFVKLSKHKHHKNKDSSHDENDDDKEINEIPIPAALWLFGSAFFGLTGLIRKKT